MEKKTCKYAKCGKEFIPNHGKQLYCSPNCKAYDFKKKETKEDFEIKLEAFFDTPENKELRKQMCDEIFNGGCLITKQTETGIEVVQSGTKEWFDVLFAKGRDNPFENAARGRDKSGINEDEIKPKQITNPTNVVEDEKNNVDVEEIKKQIAAIRAEKIPSHRSSVLGRKSWEREQQDKINKLMKQLP